MKVQVLGVNIDDVNIEEALGIVEKWIQDPGKHYIVTPNPEMIVAAQKDLSFKKILKMADLSIPDGAGLKLSGKVKNTFSGTDFMERLISLAVEKGFTTGFLGGKDGVAEKCAECLRAKYPGLKVVFAESGGEMNNEGDVIARNEVTRPARNASPARNDVALSGGQSTTEDRHASLAMTKPVDILFVALGHGKQEKWIANNLDKIPVSVAMGVGGAFDYLGGFVPRSPKWLRDLGFEWLFRLILQPWRIKRQLALIKYIWLLVKG